MIRVLTPGGEVIAAQPAKAPSLGTPSTEAQTVNGYRVVSRPAYVVEANGEPVGRVILQYGRKVSETEETVSRVELFLLLGVLAGSGLALLAGIAIARRAMAPIASLTNTAAEIARTRDPSRGVPQPAADDEVAELARTLEGMLQELDAARAETEATLARQRRFVADASHELRTPLTSVLANLELLAESLHGEQGEAASSALRSSQRMRRLVADLLLLARTDAARVVKREPCDLGQIAVEAAAELGPVSDRARDRPGHPPRAREGGARRASPSGDQPDRERPAPHAAGHRDTPLDQRRSATAPSGSWSRTTDPACRRSCRATLFERFVRGAGDRGGSFGLGLAIVQAVAGSHGGSVELEDRTDSTGARFVVRLPASSDLDDDGKDHRPALEPVVDQLG